MIRPSHILASLATVGVAFALTTNTFHGAVGAGGKWHPAMVLASTVWSSEKMPLLALACVQMYRAVRYL